MSLMVPRFARRRSATTAAVITIGLMMSLTFQAAFAAHAAAEDTPTTMQLLEQCDNGSDYCVFHASGKTELVSTATTQAGRTANCTGSTQASSVSWSKTTFTATSVGGSWKFLVGAVKQFMVGFKVSYSREWTEWKTDAETTTISVPAGHIGHVYHSRESERVSGRYELRFGKRYYGHYYWYVPVTVTSPTAGGNVAITTKSVPMSADERAAYCH